MPPEWMWPLDVDLSLWFERIREERAEKYGSSSSSDEPRTTVPMMKNELADSRR